MIRALRRARIEMRLALLLNTLLEGSVGSLSRGALYHWVFLPTGAGEELRTAYYQAGYAIPGFQFQTDSFSPAGGIPPIEVVDSMEYYRRLVLGIRPGRRLEIPNDLAESLSRFHALSANDQARYLRACFWLNHSQWASRDSESASFLALVNAVEALMPGAGPSERCPTCGQSRGKGPTRRFGEFLDHFAPYAGEIEPARASLYGTRSALSHGGLLFHEDIEPFRSGLHPRGTQESDESLYARHVVRIALVNWLYDPGGSALQTGFKRTGLPRRRRRFSFQRMVPGP
jgi:hypothetical protein